MKIKLDHVTNSSSSSFLVAFPEKVKDLNDIKKYVRKDLSKIVFEDAIEQEPMVIEENLIFLKYITEELLTGSFPTEPHYNAAEEMLKVEGVDMRNMSIRDAYSHINPIQNRLRGHAAKRLAEQFLKRNKGKYLYKFSYADEDGGINSELEHGGTFQLLSHIQISHH